MKLFIDVGNTAIKFACEKNNAFYYIGRFFTSKLNEQRLDSILSNCSQITGVYVASVVPSVANELNQYFVSRYQVQSRYITVDDYPKLKVDIDNKNELGMDLFCDLVGALKKYGSSTLVVDLGTASKILLIDKNGTFSSCVIVPGIEMSKKMLSKDTALLPDVDLKEVKKLSECRNTIDVISSSVYYGHVEMINGLINRFEKEIGYTCQHVFTGGNATKIINNISEPYVLDEHLVLEGISEIIK